MFNGLIFNLAIFNLAFSLSLSFSFLLDINKIRLRDLEETFFITFSTLTQYENQKYKSNFISIVIIT